MEKSATGIAKIKGHEWEKHPPRPWKAGGTPFPSKPELGPTMCESEVIFSKGEFLSGILDKNQYGATAYSLVSTLACFELNIVLTCYPNFLVQTK